MSDATIPAPNYTQIPNAIFELMADKDAHLTEAELRVILAIARKTFGWHKKRDKISLSQLETATAMTRKSVLSGLDAAIERGIVRRTPDKNDKRGGFFYELVVEEPNEQTSVKSILVENLHQWKNDTRTSVNSIPELVENLHPQKKDKETKETTSSGDVGDGRHVSYLLDNNMGAAKEFADLDSDTAIRDFDNRRKAGQSQAHIVRAWRAKRPTPDNYFGKPPTPNGASPPPPKTDTVSSKRLAEMTKDIPL